MTLMANLATLRDLGKAYWVHNWDSSWTAKICVGIHVSFRNRKAGEQLLEKSQVQDLNTGEVENVHLLFQLGLGQQLRDEVQTDMDGGDASHSKRKQSLRVTLRHSGREQERYD